MSTESDVASASGGDGVGASRGASFSFVLSSSFVGVVVDDGVGDGERISGTASSLVVGGGGDGGGGAGCDCVVDASSSERSGGRFPASVPREREEAAAARMPRADSLKLGTALKDLDRMWRRGRRLGPSSLAPLDAAVSGVSCARPDPDVSEAAAISAFSAIPSNDVLEPPAPMRFT